MLFFSFSYLALILVCSLSLSLIFNSVKTMQINMFIHDIYLQQMCPVVAVLVHKKGLLMYIRIVWKKLWLVKNAKPCESSDNWVDLL